MANFRDAYRFVKTTGATRKHACLFEQKGKDENLSSCLAEKVIKQEIDMILVFDLDLSIISDEILLKVLELPILVVLDEAYIEFSGLESRLQWVKKYENQCVKKYENLIVLRTFSKRAGLAGLRVGYGAFPLTIIEYLWRAKQPYNVSVAAEVSACAALENPTYLEMAKEALLQERERLNNLVKELPFLNPYPSYSNFVLCEEDLAKMGVMIRHYNNKELSGYVRISVGKPEHTDVLIDCLRRLS
ncbi:hypothetical protein GBA52_026217 [Prunus armeniaca]|nr:hypothetical protein GBA52_026217 [Prunus armeniaca]